MRNYAASNLEWKLNLDNHTSDFCEKAGGKLNALKSYTNEQVC